jgi:hypothetical protein
VVEPIAPKLTSFPVQGSGLSGSLEMTQVIVDAETVAKLHGLSGPLDFCDEQGQLLGRFIPYPAGLTPPELEPDISQEELCRRAENFEGRPLADLLAEWEKRK